MDGGNTELAGAVFGPGAEGTAKQNPFAFLMSIESPEEFKSVTLKSGDAAAGIAGADRQMPWMAFAERPMDGLEACRRR